MRKKRGRWGFSNRGAEVCAANHWCIQQPPISLHYQPCLSDDLLVTIMSAFQCWGAVPIRCHLCAC